MNKGRLGLTALVLFSGLTPYTRAQTPPDLSGVYRAIPNGTNVPGGRKNAGSPADVVLLPDAAARSKAMDLKKDPAKICQVLGPFRMMARDGLTIEIAPEPNMIAMLFEDFLHGHLREFLLNHQHPSKPGDGTWLGDSAAHWEGDTLVVDTVGYNDRTWLNDQGGQHSEELHTVERIRPILNGKYLEYKMTAEDPKALAKPYSYTRYFEKVKDEIKEDICEDE